MIHLFIASIILILYGTLFPFSFQPRADDIGVLATLVDSVHVLPGIGDTVSNIVLFLPFGFLGMLVLPTSIPALTRLALVVVLGASISLGIEILQYYMTMRTTSVYDLGLNAFGASLGALCGSVRWSRMVSGSTEPGVRPRSIFPLVMVAAWAGYRLFPYVPTVDFQQVKNAIKPMLAIETVPITGTVRHFGMVLGLALLLQAVLSPHRARLALVALALGVIVAKPFIVMKMISPAEVAGTFAALALWLAWLGRAQSRTVIVAIVFATAIALQGLAPFEFRAEPTGLSFIPFSGFLQGSMSVNIQSFLLKTFLYGTLVWLIVQTGVSTARSAAIAAAFTLAIEIAQRHIVGRTAEITDPLLVLMMGGVLLALEHHYRKASGAGPSPR